MTTESYLFDSECDAEQCPNPIKNPCGCDAMRQALVEHWIITSDNKVYYLPDMRIGSMVFDHDVRYCPFCGRKFEPT